MEIKKVVGSVHTNITNLWNEVVWPMGLDSDRCEINCLSENEKKMICCLHRFLWLLSQSEGFSFCSPVFRWPHLLVCRGTEKMKWWLMWLIIQNHTVVYIFMILALKIGISKKCDVYFFFSPQSEDRAGRGVSRPCLSFQRPEIWSNQVSTVQYNNITVGLMVLNLHI